MLKGYCHQTGTLSCLTQVFGCGILSQSCRTKSSWLERNLSWLSTDWCWMLPVVIVTWQKEWQPRLCLHGTGLWACLCGSFLMDIGKQGVKQDCSGIPLLYVLPPVPALSFCLDSLQWWPVTRKCKINPFFLHVALISALSSNIEANESRSWYQE